MSSGLGFEKPTFTFSNMSYNSDSWKYTGFLPAFFDFQNHPLVIDQRDAEREIRIQSFLTDKSRPTILLNVKGGISSPFGQSDALTKAINETWSNHFNILNLSDVKAQRIYDLLGLFTTASLIITTDTATLHLAAASTIPVIALVNDLPCEDGVEWLATIPRCNCVRRIGYSRVMDELPAIHRLVKDSTMLPRPALGQCQQYFPAHARKIYHAFEYHEEKNENTRKRRNKALNSWNVLYGNGVIANPYPKYIRDARSIGDTRALPYLKDVIKHALDMSEPEDIVFWTNDDNVLHPQLPDMLRMFISIHDCCSSQRLDFETIPSMEASPDEMVTKGQTHMGRDLFGATKRWWLEHWDNIGDSILAAEIWDIHLASYMRKTKGFDSTRQNLESIIPCVELPRGYVLHEKHQSYWTRDPKNVSNVHNKKLFKEWANAHCHSLHFTPEGTI